MERAAGSIVAGDVTTTIILNDPSDDEEETEDEEPHIIGGGGSSRGHQTSDSRLSSKLKPSVRTDNEKGLMFEAQLPDGTTISVPARLIRDHLEAAEEH